MCILLASQDPNPDYNLIVIANRDEFHHREAAPLKFWREKPHILGGRDLVAGGTWLGINRNGYLAAITNISEGTGTAQEFTTRGDIVAEFLNGKMKAQNFAKILRDRHGNYNGFNLIVYDGTTLYWDSNRSEKGETISYQPFAVSNTTPNNRWRKTERLKKSFNKALEGPSSDLPNRLLSILMSSSCNETSESVGSTKRLNTLKDNIFIRGNNYGTRCSSVILFGSDGLISFTERRFNPYGEITGQNTVSINLAFSNNHGIQ